MKESQIFENKNTSEKMNIEKLFSRLNGEIDYLSSTISDINIAGAKGQQLVEEGKKFNRLESIIGVIMDDLHNLISLLDQKEKGLVIEELRDLGSKLAVLKFNLKLKIDESSDFSRPLADEALTQDPQKKLEEINFKNRFVEALNSMSEKYVEGYLIKTISRICAEKAEQGEK